MNYVLYVCTTIEAGAAGCFMTFYHYIHYYQQKNQVITQKGGPTSNYTHNSLEMQKHLSYQFLRFR